MKNVASFMTKASLILFIGSTAAAAGTHFTHGINPYGVLQYPASFQALAYVNPNAPRGGTLRMPTVMEFQSLHPYDWANKGMNTPAPYLRQLVFERLMLPTREGDDSRYGLLVRDFEISDSWDFVILHLRPEARFSNGEPLTAEDVLFSYQRQRKSDPYFDSQIFSAVTDVQILSPHQIRFNFNTQSEIATKIAISNLGQIIILSKSFTEKHPPETWGKEIFPIGSGPYVVDSFTRNQQVIYRRQSEYWGEGLGLRKGVYNFQTVVVQHYADLTVTRMAFQRGDVDVLSSFTPTLWESLIHTKNDRVRYLETRTVSPEGFLGVRFNIEREKLRDRRVREALVLAFPFQITNQIVFGGTRTRSNSLFTNTPYAYQAEASTEEKDLLLPFRDQLSPNIFNGSFLPPENPADSSNRENLLRAAKLLREAGWTIQNGVLVNRAGQPFTLQFVYWNPTWERWMGVYQSMLKRLGIELTLRRFDSSGIVPLIRSRNFDMLAAFVRGQTVPNASDLETYFSSWQRKIPTNSATFDVDHPVVDHLIRLLKKTDSPQDKIAIARALDRVIQSEYYAIPLGTEDLDRMGVSNRLDGPPPSPALGFLVLETWWEKEISH